MFPENDEYSNSPSVYRGKSASKRGQTEVYSLYAEWEPIRDSLQAQYGKAGRDFNLKSKIIKSKINKVFLRSAIEEIKGFRFMIDKLEIQSGLAKRILNTLPYLHTPEAIAQELDKTEVMRNILQTSAQTDTITKIKVKLMQVKDIRGTANRVTELQVLDDIELFELKAFSLLVVEMRELLL